MSSKHTPDDLDALDDLDDVLDQFNEESKPAPATKPTPTSDTPVPSSKKTTVHDEKPPAAPEKPHVDDDDDSFDQDIAAQFAKGLQDMMAGLELPPGASPSTSADGKKDGTSTSAPNEPNPDQLNEDELMKQFERMLFSGTGLDQSNTTAGQSRDTPQQGTATPPKPGNFQDTIAATMDRLKTSDKNAKSSTTPGGNGAPGQEDLLKMLSALGGEGGQGAPSMDELLKSLGDLGGEAGDNEGLAQMLETMMSDLMGKEVLYGPMKEMNDQYPSYLQSEKFKALPQEDRERYTKQAGIVKELVQTFEDPKWEDPPADVPDEERPPASPAQQARQKKIQDLMNAMQECGAPPDEIVGEVPEGLEGIPGMGKDEDCTIM